MRRHFIASAMICGWIFAATLPAAPSPGVMADLRVHVDTFAIPRIDDQTPNRVIFLESMTTVDVTYSMVALPEAGGVADVEGPPPEWWSSLGWELTANGKGLAFEPQFAGIKSEKVLTPDSGNRTQGWSSTVRFNVPVLPPGKYKLVVSLAERHSSPALFLVSAGTENEALAREYARYRVEHSKNVSELKENLKEYGRRDPLNASIWTRLGDQALFEDSVDEASTYFAKAVEVFERRAKEFEGRDEVVDAIRAEQKVIQGVEELLASCLTQPGRLSVRLEADANPGTPGKRYVLADRKTGRILKVVASER